MHFERLFKIYQHFFVKLGQLLHQLQIVILKELINAFSPFFVQEEKSIYGNS